MKKVLILLLSTVLLLSLVACGQQGKSDEEQYGSNLLDAGSEQSRLYVALHKKIAEVSRGDATSTSFTVEKFKMDGSTAQFSQNLKKVLGLLWLSCPYDLYWYEEESGYQVQGNPDGDTITFTVKLPVAKDFRGGSQYEVSPASKEAIASASRYADNIVAAATGTDAEKVRYFRDQICALSEYDVDSYESQLAGTIKCGNRPWQMISVFDQDPSTKVICGGYAKAFKYLCDKAGISCKCVNGDMILSDGTTIAHFWNVVTLGGKNYVVDLTNCDDGELGHPDRLLLCGATGSLEDGYTTAVGITYRYYVYNGRGKTDMVDLFGAEALTIANTSY